MANLLALMTASGSKVFTRITGMPNDLTISDELGKLRASLGSVVKPT
eukprot:CAMPEP_0176394680 /NCGR_PEP_ID=MMETSP0126-20121128/42782_1 /TAXON_ID=141414 ORGANISM="Strombidinopsis acuminatum, Strain SPMC142" /NCGR_SAMPLE_ID=MMETSP0126 /ASSEMBLY_ACC=CAM_ASM_000229 /LENGTH=46 /DNA_ID= /DNA_START= /DNA_END= /DNA_ORIENTATION=